MYNQLLISLQIEEKWYTFRLFFGILSCYYLHSNDLVTKLCLFGAFLCLSDVWERVTKNPVKP